VRLATLTRTLLALAVTMGLATSASGLARTQRIEEPLPAEYRDLAAGFLKTIRPTDTEQALEGLKALLLPDHNTGKIHFIMRVEAACPTGHCMTLVGNIFNKAIHLDFTLEAGPTVQFGDVSYELWGARTAPPWIFETRAGAGVVAVFREQGWVLTACASCTGHTVNPPPLVPHAPAPKFDTFEAFRRALEDEGKR
jgi:hypothetical protein